MDQALRKRIEEQLARMTEEDFEEIRQAVANDPELKKLQEDIDRSDISPPNIVSGYMSRLY